MCVRCRCVRLVLTWGLCLIPMWTGGCVGWRVANMTYSRLFKCVHHCEALLHATACLFPPCCRSAIVDSSGREINSNKFIALMSAIILREHPGTTIVGLWVASVCGRGWNRRA